MHIHTIPVPEGWTADEAWRDICIMGFLTGSPVTSWANIHCDGMECASVQVAD